MKISEKIRSSRIEPGLDGLTYDYCKSLDMDENAIQAKVLFRDFV